MLYICKWPNGDLSFVQAKSKDDAVFNLDDIGGAGVEDIYPISSGDACVSINLKSIRNSGPDNARFELESFGEGLHRALSSVGISFWVDEAQPDSDSSLLSTAV
jgi:hypothetical protein